MGEQSGSRSVDAIETAAIAIDPLRPRRSTGRHILEQLLGDADAVIVRRVAPNLIVADPAHRQEGGMSTATRWVGPWIEEAETP